jgi:hypothetical protein
MNPSASDTTSIYTTRLEGESGLNSRPADPASSYYEQSQYEQSAADISSAEPAKTFTIDDALTSFGFGRTQVLMFFFTGIAWAGDGMEMMLLSYLGPEVRNQVGSAVPPVGSLHALRLQQI